MSPKKRGILWKREAEGGLGVDQIVERARRRHGYLTDRRNIWEDGQRDGQWEGVINEQERRGEGRHSICPSIVEKERKKHLNSEFFHVSIVFQEGQRSPFFNNNKIIPSKLNIRNETPLAWLDNNRSLFSWFTEGRFLAAHKNTGFPKGVPHGIRGCFSCRRQLMSAVFALGWHLATGWY